MDKSICRIGVFYDGSYFTYAQYHYYADRKLGWLMFGAFHSMLENMLREKEQGFANYRVVYAGWYQGLFTSSKSTDQQRRTERNRHIDLMYAGIEPKYVPMSQTQGEKGIDVALTVDALQVGLEGKVDIAVLVTGDADFVPLVRALIKHGVRVATAYFEYESESNRSYISERLLNTCNYGISISHLEKDRKYQPLFRGLFRQPEKHEPVQETMLNGQ
jgi:uncharacterized LabA/DUF88 family protein